MFALHKEFLTRRYLFGLLDLLLCPIGFGLRVFYICKGLRKLGLFFFKLMIHGLELLADLLELFLYFAHSGFLLFALLALQGRFVFGLGQHLLEGRHFSGGLRYHITMFRRLA